MQGPERDKPETKTASGAASGDSSAATYDFMVVSNRLPVDRCAPGEHGDDGSG